MLYAYVIMENHLHLIASAANLSKEMGNFKSFTARQIIETYIHNNPVRRGWVDEPVHWRYSSARNYADMVGLLDVQTEW